jgi:hypothetical protein
MYYWGWKATTPLLYLLNFGSLFLEAILNSNQKGSLPYMVEQLVLSRPSSMWISSHEEEKQTLVVGIQRSGSNELT